MIVFELYCSQYDLNMLVYWLSFFEPHCPQFIDLSFNHLSLSPSWSEYCLFFLLRVHYIAPWLLNFSRSIEKCQYNFCQGFCKFGQCSSCLTILFWNQLSYFKDNVYSSLIVEMKAERCQFWKRFWKSSFFDKKKSPTHVIQNIQSFDCHVFWKQKWTRCQIKMAFSWFFVSILDSEFGYLFWWFVMRWPSVYSKKTTCSSQNLRLYQGRVFPFFITYFISMHNNK
jgi:hypothetical protein